MASSAELQRKLIVGLAFVSLFGTVTNYIYISPLLALLLPLGLYVFNKKALPRPIAWLYAFLAFFLISVLLYYPWQLIEYGFYRRDGNFIISYAPLFILPLFSYKFELKKNFRRFYIFVLLIHGALFGYYLLTTNFLGGSLHDIIYGSLFHAQNALGGFFAIIGALGFAYWYQRRDLKDFLLFLLALIILMASYSRGSIIGLVLGIMGWYLAITARYKMLVILIIIPILFTAGSLMIGYPYFKSKLAVDNYVEKQIDTDVGQKNANVMIRLFYTFPRAWYLFTESPIFGTGVGSYDDQPLELEEVVPYVRYNSQPNKEHTDAHAHHSYLQLLAEQGVVGLIMFLVFWISLYFYLRRIEGQPIMRNFFLIAYFAITFASFTEHRITTPAMMLPFTISVGLFMMHKEEFQHVIITEIEC